MHICVCCLLPPQNASWLCSITVICSVPGTSRKLNYLLNGWMHDYPQRDLWSEKPLRMTGISKNSWFVVHGLSFVPLYDQCLLCYANINLSEMCMWKKKGLHVRWEGKVKNSPACPAPSKPRLLIGGCGLLVFSWTEKETWVLYKLTH